MSEAFYPRDCSCNPLAFGSVTYFDETIKEDVTRTVATKAVRVRDCNVHGANNPRCNGKYLGRMAAV